MKAHDAGRCPLAFVGNRHHRGLNTRTCFRSCGSQGGGLHGGVSTAAPWGGLSVRNQQETATTDLVKNIQKNMKNCGFVNAPTPYRHQQPRSSPLRINLPHPPPRSEFHHGTSLPPAGPIANYPQANAFSLESAVNMFMESSASGAGGPAGSSRGGGIAGGGLVGASAPTGAAGLSAGDAAAAAAAAG